MAGERLVPTMVGLLVWAGMLTVLVSHVESQRVPGDVVIVSSILERPYLYKKNTTRDVRGNDRYEGFVKDLLDKLTTLTNYRYELSIQTSYGTFVDGSWSGMVGDIVNKQAQLAFGPLTETLFRAQYVEFGSHFQTFGRVAIVKQWPGEDVTFTSISLDVRLGRLFAPLDDSVWLLSGMAWFVASLVLYIICRINPFEWRRMVKDRTATLREGESFNCVNSYWFMLAAIFWQGFMRSPRSMGARIVVTFWWLYALIFVSMYIASLTNYLQSLPQSNQVIHKYSRIKSLGDILEDHNVKVGVIKGSATEQFLKNSKNRLYDSLWTRIEKDKTYAKTLEAGIEKVRASTREDQYVFFAESTMAEYFIRQPPCDLYMIRDFPFTGSYAPAYPKDSGLKSQMDLALYRIKVDLASFSGALILLMIGLAAGSVVTLLEIFIFKYFGKEDQDNEQDKRPMTEKPESSKPKRPESPMTDV